MLTTSQLLENKCSHASTALTPAELSGYLQAVDGWTVIDGKLCHKFTFNNYYETLSFINAIAYVIHAEDHHPELLLTYNQCDVKFHTHSVNGGKGGLSINDFICAAKIGAIFQQSYAHD
jgi:4a-hydroxytetrahydrobiopterin dehydratase